MEDRTTAVPTDESLADLNTRPAPAAPPLHPSGTPAAPFSTRLRPTVDPSPSEQWDRAEAAPISDGIRGNRMLYHNFAVIRSSTMMDNGYGARQKAHWAETKHLTVDIDPHSECTFVLRNNSKAKAEEKNRFTFY